MSENRLSEIFFRAGIDGFDHGDAPEQAVPSFQEFSAQYVGRQHAGDEQNHDGDDETLPRNLQPQLVFQPPLFGNQVDEFVGRADDIGNDPDGDDDG